MAVTVTNRNEKEETLKHRIKQLKKREKRHRLEAQLREKIFKRYKKMYEKIED